MRWLAATAIAVLFTGCIEPGGPAQLQGEATSDPSGWPTALGCAFCYEPTIVADGSGGFWVDDWAVGLTHVHANGSVIAHEPPPLPEGLATRNEPAMAVADGALVYAFTSHNGVGVEDEILAGEPSNQILTYRLEGSGWTPTGTIRPGEASGLRYTGADRPWLASNGRHVVLSWATLNPRTVELAVSDDGGRTFGAPVRAIGHEQGFGDISPRPAVAVDGSILVPAMLGTTTHVGGVDLPGRLSVAVSSNGEDWATRDGPTLRPDEGPATYLAWTGTAWSPQAGFVLAWATDAGRILVSMSADAQSWSAPVLALEMGGAGYHPWLEASGACLTLSAWQQDRLVPDGARLHLASAGPDLAWRSQVVAEPSRMLTDFPSHAVVGRSAVVPWSADGETRLGVVPLLDC